MTAELNRSPIWAERIHRLGERMGGTRGMNLAIAKRYAEHGANVVVVIADPERLLKFIQHRKVECIEAIRAVQHDCLDAVGSIDAQILEVHTSCFPLPSFDFLSTRILRHFH